MTLSIEQIDEMLMQATCEVRQGEQVKGTAWLLDNEGHLLTAAHVLGKSNPVSEVEVLFPEEDFPTTATKVHWEYDYDRGIDWAILKLTPPPPKRTALPISLARNAQGEFSLFGYGKTLVNISPGVGKFVGPYHPQNKAVNRLFALETGQTREGGYSGAAVFSHVHERVIAIQTEGTTVPGDAAHGNTVLAMPLYRIAQRCVEKGEPIVRILSETIDGEPKEYYSFHVYLSYVRGGVQETWVEKFLLGELTSWLRLELKDEDPQIFYNHNAERSIWDDTVRDAIRRSYCLVPVLTAGYWRCPECLAELESFRARQSAENLALTRGILFHEGGKNPEDPLDAYDFQKHAKVYEGFRGSASYGRCQVEVQKFAKQLAGLISNAPEYETSWPVVEPVKMKSRADAVFVRIARPRL